MTISAKRDYRLVLTDVLGGEVVAVFGPEISSQDIDQQLAGILRRWPEMVSLFKGWVDEGYTAPVTSFEPALDAWVVPAEYADRFDSGVYRGFTPELRNIDLTSPDARDRIMLFWKTFAESKCETYARPS